MFVRLVASWLPLPLALMTSIKRNFMTIIIIELLEFVTRLPPMKSDEVYGGGSLVNMTHLTGSIKSSFLIN